MGRWIVVGVRRRCALDRLQRKRCGLRVRLHGPQPAIRWLVFTTVDGLRALRKLSADEPHG
jgi:hypothetical protein